MVIYNAGGGENRATFAFPGLSVVAQKMENITLHIISSHACAAEFAPAPAPAVDTCARQPPGSACLPAQFVSNMGLQVLVLHKAQQHGFGPAWPEHSMCRVHGGLDGVRADVEPSGALLHERRAPGSVQQHGRAGNNHGVLRPGPAPPGARCHKVIRWFGVAGAHGGDALARRCFQDDGQQDCHEFLVHAMERTCARELPDILTFRMQKVDVCAASGAEPARTFMETLPLVAIADGGAFPEVFDSNFSGTLRKKCHGTCNNRTVEHFQKVDHVTSAPQTLILG